MNDIVFWVNIYINTLWIINVNIYNRGGFDYEVNVTLFQEKSFTFQIFTIYWWFCNNFAFVRFDASCLSSTWSDHFPITLDSWAIQNIRICSLATFSYEYWAVHFAPKFRKAARSNSAVHADKKKGLILCVGDWGFEICSKVQIFMEKFGSKFLFTKLVFYINFHRNLNFCIDSKISISNTKNHTLFCVCESLTTLKGLDISVQARINVSDIQ